MKRLAIAVYHISRWLYYVAGVAGIMLVIYFAIDLQRPIIKIHGGKIVNQEVNPGDRLHVVWSLTTYRKCPVEVTRSVWGECGTFPLDGYSGMFPAHINEPETHHIRVDLPKSLDSGACHYHAEVTYYCNALSKLFPQTVAFPDLPFNVVNDGNLP